MIHELDPIEKELIRVASHKYGIQQSDILKHGRGFQNYVYEYHIDEIQYILRISKATTRSEEEILSELNFLNHLSQFDISVSLPVKSLNGQLLEQITLGKDNYYAVTFEKALGRHITYPDYLNNHEMFYRLGQITGKLHRASKSFSGDLNNRINWTENYYLNKFTEFIPCEEAEKINSLRKQIVDIEKIDKTPKNFGLIHGDINVGNFFVDNNHITLFDFDESQNSWYVEDIAIQLFYTVYVFCDDSIEERQKKATEFMQYFLKGYELEHDVELEMLKLIPKFLILREMIVHVGMYKMWDLSTLTGWAQDYYRDSSKRIKDQIPIVEFDTEWCNYLQHKG